jgi:hypothetical protein
MGTLLFRLKFHAPVSLLIKAGKAKATTSKEG